MLSRGPTWSNRWQGQMVIAQSVPWLSINITWWGGLIWYPLTPNSARLVVIYLYRNYPWQNWFKEKWVFFHFLTYRFDFEFISPLNLRIFIDLAYNTRSDKKVSRLKLLIVKFEWRHACIWVTYNKLMMFIYLGKSVPIIFISIFFKNTGLCKCSTLYTHQTQLSMTFSCFLNWKFISWVKFEDMEDIKRNTIQ